MSVIYQCVNNNYYRLAETYIPIQNNDHTTRYNVFCYQKAIKNAHVIEQVPTRKAHYMLSKYNVIGIFKSSNASLSFDKYHRPPFNSQQLL